MLLKFIILSYQFINLSYYSYIYSRIRNYWQCICQKSQKSYSRNHDVSNIAFHGFLSINTVHECENNNIYKFYRQICKYSWFWNDITWISKSLYHIWYNESFLVIKAWYWIKISKILIDLYIFQSILYIYYTKHYK